VRYKRPTKPPTPEYDVDALMNWTKGILDDGAVFPNTIGMPPCHPSLCVLDLVADEDDEPV